MAGRLSLGKKARILQKNKGKHQERGSLFIISLLTNSSSTSGYSLAVQGMSWWSSSSPPQRHFLPGEPDGFGDRRGGERRFDDQRSGHDPEERAGRHHQHSGPSHAGHRYCGERVNDATHFRRLAGFHSFRMPIAKRSSATSRTCARRFTRRSALRTRVLSLGHRAPAAPMR